MKKIFFVLTLFSFIGILYFLPISALTPPIDGVLPNSQPGTQIRDIISFLQKHGFGNEAGNIAQFLMEGKIDIKGTGKDGQAVWPGSDVTVGGGLFPTPPDTTSLSTSDPRDGKVADTPTDVPHNDYTLQLHLMTVLLHEKYHSEKQDVWDRLWYVPWLFTLPGHLFDGVGAFNPMETETYENDLNFLDRLIGQVATSCFEFPHNSVEWNRCQAEIIEIREWREIWHQHHNDNFFPDIVL